MRPIIDLISETNELIIDNPELEILYAIKILKRFLSEQAEYDTEERISKRAHGINKLRVPWIMGDPEMNETRMHIELPELLFIPSVLQLNFIESRKFRLYEPLFNRPGGIIRRMLS